jgi:soluble lytic murein transglycosylase
MQFASRFWRAPNAEGKLGEFKIAASFGPMKYRAALFVAVFLAGVVMAPADETLPRGLIRSGGVVMMQPIGEGDSGTPLNSEHRPGNVRFLAAGDRDLYQRAFQAADHGDWVAARSLADQGHDAIARKLIEWRRLLDKNSGASFSDIDAFLKSNPDWPLREALLARAEAALGPELSPAGVVAWFGNRQPASSLGRVRLGEALVATGNAVTGREMIRQGWRQGDFDPPQELAIVQKDGALLTLEDDRTRLDNLLWRDETTDAQRELARLDDVSARIGALRIALRTDPQRAKGLLATLPSSAYSDPNLLFDRARAARHAGDSAEAESLLLRIASHEPARAHPTKWWSEFNAEARQALEDKNFRTAYGLASDAGLSPSDDEYKESQFLAGWIALRFLAEPQSALTHFQRLDAMSSRPISKARAAYWQGRAYEAMHQPAEAWREYVLASKSPETFYGQIALTRLDAHPLLHVPDVMVEPVSREAFEKEEMTRAMEVLADLGEENLLRDFAMRDLDLYSSTPHVRLLMQELTEWGFREIALRIAKSKSYDGILMQTYTHPVIPIPTYMGPQPGPETALVLGLIRQETEFDPDSVSGPGARGLMQLMPESAKKAAADAGLAYRPNDLLSDTNYNMQLGMTELSGDLKQWSGSYILATASYNAGVHNADKWIMAFGDPRLGNVDPIDWVESIPFTETRNYVQRVLENTQIYRNRLAGRDTTLRILADLYQDNGRTVKPLDYQPPRAELVPAHGAAQSPQLANPDPPAGSGQR